MFLWGDFEELIFLFSPNANSGGLSLVERSSLDELFLKNRLRIPFIKLGFFSSMSAYNKPGPFTFNSLLFKGLFLPVIFFGVVFSSLDMFLSCSSLRTKVSKFFVLFKASLKTSPFVLSMYISLSIIFFLPTSLIEDKVPKSSSVLFTNNEFDSEPFSPG